MNYKRYNLLYCIVNKFYRIMKINLIILGCSISFNSYANCLGMINVLSSYDEPFKAIIPISPNTDIENLKITIARDEEFTKKGILKEEFINKINLEIIKNDNGNVLELSSKESVDIDFFAILMRVFENGKEDTYSAFIDFDNPKPIASLIFGTKISQDLIGYNFAKAEQVNTKIEIQPVTNNNNLPDLLEKDNVINSEVEINYQELQKINDAKVLDTTETKKANSDLAPEDNRVFKSKLYQEIINKSQTNMQDIYIPTNNSSQETSKKVNNQKLDKQAYRERLKVLNKSIAYDDEQYDDIYSVNDDDFLQFSMGNSAIANTLNGDIVENSVNKNTQDDQVFRILSMILLIALLLIGYVNMRRRNVLKEIYLGKTKKSGNSETVNKNIKKLLRIGEFDEAVKLFKYEFKHKGMNLHQLCKSYLIFQKYGVKEFTQNPFLDDSVPDTKNKSNKNKDVSLKKSHSLHERKIKNDQNTIKQNKDYKQDNIDLSEVADDIMTAKLNLANAYINMGDFARANNILKEVCQSGNPQQRREASRLIKKFNN